jgi:PPM family protein phosphatase
VKENTVQLQMAGATDIGRRRKGNQDSLFYDALQGIGIVADGIGGRKGGEVASSMAVEGLRRAFLESERIRHEEINPFLVTAIDKINQGIIEHGQANKEVEGLGTTLNCLMFVGDKLYIAHVGDSRTYMFFEGHLWQLTIDHNIKTFVDRGWLPKTALANNPRGAALVRSLGLVAHCEVDVYEVPLKGGEIFLTCSDGLSGMVDDHRIGELISRGAKQFEKLPEVLIEEANRNGGRDNITVILSQVKAVG